MSETSLVPYKTRAELFVAGSVHEGGRGLIRDEWGESHLQFPSLLFALLTVLIEKAQRDKNRDHEIWAPLGFMSAEQMYAALRRKKVAVEPKRIAKHVFRLREVFRRARSANNGDDFGSQFLEYQTGLGHRLSTPPSLLHLDLMEDSP